uniref:N1-21 subtype b protein n=1 Tax=Babesia microti TaxID=5868 RepID=Q869H9_BABMI|nr:N1-21 subtype b protein [Babesia microti]
MKSVRPILIHFITFFLTSGNVFAGNGDVNQYSSDFGRALNDLMIAFNEAKKMYAKFSEQITDTMIHTCKNSIDILEADEKNGGHKNYLEKKEIELKSKIVEFNAIFSNIDLNNSTVKNEIIKLLNDISTISTDIKSIVDEIYYKALGTIEGENAENFEYEIKKKKAELLRNLLNDNIKPIMGYLTEIYNMHIPIISNKSEFNDIKKAFEKHELEANVLISKILENNQNFGTNFNDILNEVNGAIEEFNKTIDVMNNTIGDLGIVIDSGIISSIKSYISTIAKISNSIIPGQMALVFTALILILN